MMAGGGSAPLRAAIIGAGLMGRWHADAVQHAGHRVVSVCDADGARAAQLAGRLRADVANDVADALAGCDVVHVCTPTASHLALATAALQAGCSVICEKPVAMSLPDVEALFALAASRGLVLVPTHQFVLQRGMQQVLSRLSSLGTLRHVDATALTAGATGRDAAGAEAVALEVLPHPLSLIERLVPGVLASLTWSVPGATPGELRAVAGTADCTFDILVSCDGRPPVNQLRVVGTSGTAQVDLFHGFAVIDTGRASRAQKMGQPFATGARQVGAAAGNLALRAARREPAYPGLRELVVQAYAAIRTGAPPPLLPSECLAVAAACAQIRANRPAMG